MAWKKVFRKTSTWQDITPSKDGGVLKRIIQPGVGDLHPPFRSIVKVHYTGKLLSGEVFDSSVKRGVRFVFTLGVGSVMKGWDIGVATMTKNEKCLLQIRSDYAYGERGSPPKIGPNETLMFEIDLLKFSGEGQKKERVRISLPTEGYILNSIKMESEKDFKLMLINLEDGNKGHMDARTEVKWFGVFQFYTYFVRLYFQYMMLFYRYGIGKPESVKLTVSSFERAEKSIKKKEFEDAVFMLEEIVKIDDRSSWMNAQCSLLIVAIKVVTKKYEGVRNNVIRALSHAIPNFKDELGFALHYIKAVASLQHHEKEFSSLTKGYEKCLKDLNKCLEMGGARKLDKKSLILISFLKQECLKRQSTFVNHYEILGVPEHATYRIIDKAYKRLVFKYHPDRCAPELKKEYVEMIGKFNAAKDVLTSPKRRTKFDMKLRWVRPLGPGNDGDKDRKMDKPIPLQPYWDDIERILKELNVFQPYKRNTKIRAAPTTNDDARSCGEERRPSPAPKASFKELVLMRKKYEEVSLNDFKIVKMLGESEYFSIPCLDFICQLKGNGEELLLKIAKNEILPGVIRPPLKNLLELVRRPAMEIGYNPHVVSCLKMWEEKVEYSRLPGVPKWVSDNMKAEETGLFLFKHYRKTLRDLKRERKGKYSEKDYMQIVKQVLEGAYHLDFSKIVHKCLTLDNVFVDETGGKDGNFVLKIGNFNKAMDVSKAKNFKVYISKELLPHFDFGEISKYPEREHFFGNEEFNFRHCGIFSVGLLCHDLISHPFKEELSVWGRKMSNEIPIYSTPTKIFVQSLTAPARMSLKDSLVQCRLICSKLSGSLVPPSESGGQQSQMNRTRMGIESPQGKKKKKSEKSSGKGFEWEKPNVKSSGFSWVPATPTTPNPWNVT